MVPVGTPRDHQDEGVRHDFRGARPESCASNKEGILQMVRRIFEMAVEEGILDRNPAWGFR